MLTRVKCPICRQEAPWEGNSYRPFCSERCRTIDLGVWASESYRIPGERVGPEAVSAEEEKTESGKPKT